MHQQLHHLSVALLEPWQVSPSRRTGRAAARVRWVDVSASRCAKLHPSQPGIADDLFVASGFWLNTWRALVSPARSASEERPTHWGLRQTDPLCERF